jgi:SnoaL-like domain
VTHEVAVKRTTEGGAVAQRQACDRTEVEDLLLKYTMSVDLREWGPFRSCFADRVLVRLDPALGESPAEPIMPEEWAPLASAHLNAPVASQHYHSIYSLEIDESRGEAEVIMQYRGGRGERIDEPLFVCSVFFTYRCRRSAQGWKIAEISARAMPEAIERGPELDASFDLDGDIFAEARPRRRAGKGVKRQMVRVKRSPRTAAKRR